MPARTLSSSGWKSSNNWAMHVAAFEREQREQQARERLERMMRQQKQRSAPSGVQLAAAATPSPRRPATQSSRPLPNFDSLPNFRMSALPRPPVHHALMPLHMRLVPYAHTGDNYALHQAAFARSPAARRSRRAAWEAARASPLQVAKKAAVDAAVGLGKLLPLSGVWCLVSGVWCLVSGDWRLAVEG